MAIINPPSWLQAGTYSARADRLGIGSAISIGGVTAPTSYAVTQTLTPSMSIQVSSGSAYVPNTFGLTQGFYAVVNDGTVTVPLDASHFNFNRTDLIVLTVKDSQYAGVDNFAVIEKITGSPGPGANPAPNPVPANSIVLASVLVTASASSVTSGNISIGLRQIARLQPSMVNAVQTVTPSTYPSSVMNGQFIIDETLDQLRVWMNGRWFTLSPSTMSNVGTAGERPPGARTGTIVYEQPTKRFYSYDGTKWNYAGGGGGESSTTSFVGWNPNYRNVTGTPQGFMQPLTIWKDAEGRYNLEGTFTNSVNFSGWTQYAAYGICLTPPEATPTYDLRAITAVIAPGEGNEEAHILIRGKQSNSSTPGAPGTIMWQPCNSRTWSPVSGNFIGLVPRMSWYVA